MLWCHVPLPCSRRSPVGRRTLTGLLPEGATSGLQVVGNRRGRDGLAKRSATPSTRTHPKPGASFRVSCSFAGRATHVTFLQRMASAAKTKNRKARVLLPTQAPLPQNLGLQATQPSPSSSPVSWVLRASQLPVPSQDNLQGGWQGQKWGGRPLSSIFNLRRAGFYFTVTGRSFLTPLRAQHRVPVSPGSSGGGA